MFENKPNPNGLISNMIKYNPLKGFCNIVTWLENNKWGDCNEGVIQSTHQPSNNKCIYFWEGVVSFLFWLEFSLFCIFTVSVLLCELGITENFIGIFLPVWIGIIPATMALVFIGFLISVCGSLVVGLGIFILSLFFVRYSFVNKTVDYETYEWSDKVCNYLKCKIKEIKFCSKFED